MQRAKRHNPRRKTHLSITTSGKPQELLRRVRATILADPLILDMDDFFTDGFLLSGRRQYDIAGLALMLSGRDVESVMDPHEQARNVLGLSSRAAKSLFIVSDWPEDFRRGYMTEPSTLREYNRNAKLAARRLRQYCVALG
jgi:hypothetical protein